MLSVVYAEDCSIHIEYEVMMEIFDLLKNIDSTDRAVIHIGSFVRRHNFSTGQEKILVLPMEKCRIGLRCGVEGRKEL